MMEFSVDNFRVFIYWVCKKTPNILVLIKSFSYKIGSEHLWDSVTNGSRIEES